MKKKNADKVTTRLFAVMDRDFNYEYYTKHTVEKGTRHRVGPYGHRLTNEGFIIILGHGADQLVPKGCFHLEEEVTTVKMVTTTETRRVKF